MEISLLKEIKALLQQGQLAKKEHLTFKEACQYLDLSESYLYKLTSSHAIPYYVPIGKKIFFRRDDLDAFIFNNRQSSKEEIEAKVDAYLLTKKGPNNGK